MDCKTSNFRELIGATLGRSYDNTVIANGARAHLGDVSQEVNINGGLHLHLQAPLKAVTVAGSVMQSIHFADRIVKLVQRMGDNTATAGRRDLEVLRELIGELPTIVTQLQLATSSNLVSLCSPTDEKALHELVELVRSDAQGIYKVLAQFDPNLKNNVWLQNGISSAAVDFFNLWKAEALETRLIGHCLYRGKLNKCLDTLLNGNMQITGSHEVSSNARTERCEATKSNQGADIVQILSMNRPVRIGLENTAAILIRRDGELVILTPDSHCEEPLKTEPLDGDNADHESPDKHATALIEHKPNLFHLITQALYFREETNRQIEVKEAHSRTFSWILQDVSGASAPHFSQWLKHGNHCFWINGKAGSGKSTLMKYIHQHPSLHKLLKEWAGQRQLVIGSFFFWHAGQPLQKSYEGILRALLHQILDSRPSLTPIIFPRLSRFLLLRKVDDNLRVSEQELQEAVIILTGTMPKDLALFLMIDGVDEYSGDHFEFARFLARISENDFVKVVASSRPTPACHQVFSRFPSLRLQDLTAGDIRAYVDDELVHDELFQEMECLEPGFAQEVTEALTDKASGVFLWIVLVVKRLLVGLGNYDDRKTLTAGIDELPSDLEELYDYMFGKMSIEHQHEGSLLLQLISYAREIQYPDLTASQLFIVHQHLNGTDTLAQDTTCSYQEEALQVKAVDGRLRSRCCGLVEVQYLSALGPLPEPKVDFLHRTVTDYVRDPLVSDKLRGLCKLDLELINTALLASCLGVMRRKTNSSTKFELDRLVEKFSACLAYSHELSCLGNISYVPYLEVADKAYFDCCTMIQRSAPYWQSCDLVVSHRRFKLPTIDRGLERGSSGVAASLLMFSKLGLSDYFEKKLSAQTRDPAFESLMLLQLMNLVVHHVLVSLDSSFLQSYIRNICALLRHGCDPNFPAQYTMISGIKPDNLCYATDRVPNQVPVAMKLSNHLIPWNYWLTVVIDTPLRFDITLQLVKAGAQLESNFEPKVQALTHLRNTLEQCRVVYKHTEYIGVIDELLERMHYVTRRSKKRFSPDKNLTADAAIVNDKRHKRERAS